jgi:SAM-dependent methyltransferase
VEQAQKQHTLADWREPAYANAWNDRDALRDLLDLPRRMAAALIGYDASPRTVLDIGSGPGAFLEIFLDAFPDARGTWTDASEAMRDIAVQSLARFGDRVTYVIADMTDLSAVAAPQALQAPETQDQQDVPATAATTAAAAGAADVVLSSRASHHLDPAGLAVFYAQAAERLNPQGWMVNLDHIGPANAWNTRYRAARPQFTGPRRAAGEGHKHTSPLPSLDDHLAAMTGAGFGDVDLAWKAFGTVMLLGRKA